MILELDIGRCASEDAGPPKGKGGGGWIMKSHVDWRGNKTFLIRVETFP